MNLSDIIKKLVELDDVRVNVHNKNDEFTFGNDLNFLYDTYYERLQKRAYVADDYEKDAANEYLNRIILKRDIMFRDLIQKEELFGDREDIKYYLEQEKVEVETALKSLNDIKKVIGREDIKETTL